MQLSWQKRLICTIEYSQTEKERGNAMSKNYIIRVLKMPDVTDLAGEKVMIDFESGKYFMLTGSANDIWDMLSDGLTSDAIVNALLEIYEIDKPTCSAGVEKFLNELSEIGFIGLEDLD